MRILVGFALVLLTTACASGHCRKAQQPTTGLEDSTTGEKTAPGDSSLDKRVLVFKYDGTLQCKMGKPVSLNEMKNELKGLPIYSMEKKQDGQMHIQVCGSITGQANVYEISGQDLKEAEKRGFRIWSFK